MIIKNKTILVTGGAGFLGSWIVETLASKGPKKIIIPRSRDHDLRCPEQTARLFRGSKPDLVIHTAVKSGGIGFMLSSPAEILQDNLRISLNVLEASAKASVERLLLVGSSCAYPAALSGRLKEESLFEGALHPSIAHFAISRHVLLLGSDAFRKQYGLRSSYIVLPTLYGPRDAFRKSHSHVVSAMIERFVDAQRAGSSEVVCWGSGTPKREFLYVKDAAEGVVKALQKYDSPEPMNLGTGRATSIRQLAVMIRKTSGFRGAINWDRTKPDGAACKVLDVSKMRRTLQWEPPTRLENGLKETVEWFRAEERS